MLKQLQKQAREKMKKLKKVLVSKCAKDKDLEERNSKDFCLGVLWGIAITMDNSELNNLIHEQIELAVRKTKESVPCEEKERKEKLQNISTSDFDRMWGYNQHVNEVKEWQNNT